MTQKLKTIIFATALTALAACSDDVATGRYSVGEEDNLVRLSTGVQSAPSTALPSRAAVSEATHYALATGTAGECKLYNVGDREAAMLMAIVANKLGKPLNTLRFKSMKEVI